MAKTRAQWEALYNTEATSEGVSTSTTAEWLLFRNIFISLLILLEGIIEFFKADVESTLATKQPGSIGWMPGMIKEYQHGDTLIVENGQVKYATVNESLRIIEQVSVRENDSGILDIKLAKDDGTGVLIALDNTELTAVKAYIDARFSPGVGKNVVSRDADTLTTTLIGKFNKNYAKATVLADIAAAFEAHKLEFNTETFGDIFYKSQLHDRLMEVPGMVSISQLSIDVAYGIGGSATNIGEETILPAGYFNFDAGSVVNITAV